MAQARRFNYTSRPLRARDLLDHGRAIYQAQVHHGTSAQGPKDADGWDRLTAELHTLRMLAIRAGYEQAEAVIGHAYECACDMRRAARLRTRGAP